MPVATAVFPLFCFGDLEVGVVVAVVLREFASVLQVEVLIGNHHHFERLSEDFPEAAFQDAPFRKFIPDGQNKHYDSQIEGKTILVVRVDEFVDEGLRIVVLLYWDEHYDQVEEGHEQRVQLQLPHYLSGKAIIEFVLAYEPPQEQPLIDPVEDDQGKQSKLKSNGYDGRHGRTNQDSLIDIGVPQGQINGVPLIEVIGLALRGSELLGDPPPPVQPPPPHNIEIAHHAAHIGVGDEEEEEVVDQSQEVEWEVRVGAFPVGNDPEGNQVREVGRGQHVYHEDIRQLIPDGCEVVRHCRERTVFPREMPDHYTQQSVEAAADDRAGSRHSDQEQLVYGRGLLHLYEFLQQGQDEEIADQGENKKKHVTFGHFLCVFILWVGKILINEVCWIVALLYGVFLAVLTDKFACFDTIKGDNALTTEQQIG